MPDSGTKDYVLTFEALPEETQVIHLLNPTSTEGNTYDISLIPQTKKNASPLTAIRGNWFGRDESNAWEYGIYDSISIMNNRIYSNESIRKKGKKVEITVKDKQNGDISTLLVTPMKDGTCKIQVDGKQTKWCTRQCSPIKAMATDEDSRQFFRRDTAYFQGYIDGYDRRLGFDTGLIYLSNEITREDYPTVVEIDKDGSFKCKFVLSYPTEERITLNNCWLPFYIEPGQTLTMYIAWEDLLARSRARDYNYPIKNTAYMGPSASLSYLANECDKLLSYPYSDLSKSQKTLTPNQYKEHMKSITAKWNQVADSIRHAYRISPKASRFIKNKISLLTGNALLDFLMSRDYYAKQDTTNQALKVKEDDSYYDFLKEMPHDDKTILTDERADIFINRFEYMAPLREAYSYEVEKEYTDYIDKQKPSPKEESQQTDDRISIAIEQKYEKRKDAIIARLCNTPNPLLWQIAKVRHLTNDLQNIKTKSIAREYIDDLKQKFTEPFLITEAEQLFKNAYPSEDAKSYQLPEGKATEIFRNIIKNHPGKVLFVDFWATSCGPCRGGIEATADLRKKYKNHPEFQFIYITGERESPAGAYKQYVEKHLKGEASYYVTGTEYNYLRQLFHFNGIPHYELVEKDGSISNEKLSSYTIGEYLKKRFGTSEPSETEQNAE